MTRLTRQEQKVVVIILLLLLTGWGVKAYRTAHPPPLFEPEPIDSGHAVVETGDEQ